MNFSRPQLKIVLAALEAAIRDTNEFIDCHMQYGKSIDPKLTKKEQKMVEKYLMLTKKIREYMTEFKEKKSTK